MAPELKITEKYDILVRKARVMKLANMYDSPYTMSGIEAFLAKEDAIRRERYLKTTKGKSTLRMMLRDTLRKTCSSDEI